MLVVCIVDFILFLLIIEMGLMFGNFNRIRDWFNGRVEIIFFMS